MKRIGIIMSVLALCGGTFSDLVGCRWYSQTELNGTARYLGMGGAFGALGGDISAMNTDPASLAVYKNSEVVTTLGFVFGTREDQLAWFEVDNSRTEGEFSIIYHTAGYSRQRMMRVS